MTESTETRHKPGPSTLGTRRTDSRALSAEEVVAMEVRRQDAWQEDLANVVRGSSPGFRISIDTAGLDMEDQSTRDGVRAQAQSVYNQVRHYLWKGADAVGIDRGSYRAFVELRRSGPAVLLWRVLDGEGRQTPLPPGFADAVLAIMPRYGSNRRNKIFPGDPEKRTIAERVVKEVIGNEDEIENLAQPARRARAARRHPGWQARP